MLELIFRGFVEWSYGLVLECWEYFSSALLGVMSMDFAYLKSHIPVLAEIQQILLAVGWALLIGNLVFQALKSMTTGLGFEGEDPKLLFTRTFVFAFLLLASPQICEIGLNMTQTIINYLDIPDAVNITFAEESWFGGLAAAWILVVICGLIVMFKVFGLIIEIAERYIILAILTLCAPLAFGVGGSRNTSDIFSGWCRMFGSMCFVMVTNVIFFKMLLSVLSFVPSGLDVLPWMVLVFGIVKVAKKIDAIITRIGLNPAITGDSLGGRSLPGMLTYAVVRAVGQQVAKSAGKNMGGSRGRGGRTAPPSGGGPNSPRTGPVSGGAHFTAGTAGTGGRSAGAAAQNSQQTGATHSAQNQTPDAPQGAASQSGSQYTDARQQSTGSSFVGRVNSKAQSSAVHQVNSARKTSATPGKRRGASHVPVAGQPGTAGMSRGQIGTAGAIAGLQGGDPGHPRDGMAGTGRAMQAGRIMGSAVGMHSGTAGTGQPGAASPAGHKAPHGSAAGTAGKAPAKPTRFTSVSSQKVQEGGADSRVTASEQNNITMAQGAQTGGAAAEHRQPAPLQGSARKQTPAATRFTARQTGTAHASETSQASTYSSPKAAPITRTPSVFSASAGPVAGNTQAGSTAQRPDSMRQASGRVRHSRNGPPSGSTTGQSGGHPPSTARQEQPSASTHPVSKAASPVTRPGTAGMAARTEKAAQTRQTAQKQASASKSVSTATGTTGGRRPSSPTPARQEQRRSDNRKSSRREGNGGVKDGK